ncbi:MULTISPECIES: cysteine desulfurase family protein [Methylomonas]|uniref:Cysteine desulfurase n=2 Tax=Methylomonas TaxID=416 RepID=A0A140E577_9GAMM|nr:MULTISPECIES: cysteine desulfurase family protein [Methylomonas]AMK75551.1 cysteine desulfurase [Methylomonas denitrificans]OAI09170.1 cysteine desulfurase [Methylomonas methanica]TCV79047.1 cysteine desulfurase [Methylomonas methanica]
MIYLDHNATTRCDERVLEAMLPYLSGMYGNPSSLYKLGRIARSAIDIAREQVAALIDASAARIVFTSGGTEANALALANARGVGLAISAIEHPSIFENAECYRRNFKYLQSLAVDRAGVLPLLSLDNVKWQVGDMASVMLANNETGLIQDVAAIAEHLSECGVNVHTDAVQALGKMPFSFKKLGVKLMSLSSHKIYGPKGCGALVVAEDFVLKPLQRGGDQEHGWRAGTENVVAIVGFGKAAELAKAEMGLRELRMLGLRTRLEQALRTIPGLVIFAEHAKRLPNTVQFGIPGINGEMLLMRLDQRNIAVSSGSACSASSGEVSPVLAAMGVDASLARSAIRVSLGKDNNETEIDQFVDALKASIAN